MPINLKFSDNIIFNQIECEVTNNLIKLTNIPKHSNIFKKNDFYIKDHSGDIYFILEVIDYKTIFFHCSKTIDLNEYTILGLKFYDVDRKEILTNSMQILYKNTNEPNDSEPTTEYLKIPKRNLCDIPMPYPEEKQNEDWLQGFNIIEFKKQNGEIGTKLNLKIIGKFIPENFEEILIEKYELVSYLDYPISKDIVKFKIDEEMNEQPIIEYQLEKNYIYLISFLYKEKEYYLNYIWGKPDIYFSSIRAVRNSLRDKNLELTGDEFQLKLKIWSLSNFIFSFVRLVKFDMPQHKKNLLEDYINSKIIYDILKEKINSITFDDNSFKENTKVLSVSITDFSTSTNSNTAYEILVKTLKQYNTRLNSLEYKLKEAFKTTAIFTDKKDEVKNISSLNSIKKSRKSYINRW